MEEIKPVYSLRVATVSDIARFAALMITLGQPAYIIHFNHNGENFYGLLAIYHDYFELKGIPIFYYYSGKEEGKYLLIKVDDSGEQVTFSDKTRTGWISIPIITLKEKPQFIQV
jgi:hypothetical protein